jgi:protein-disulfide isomerase
MPIKKNTKATTVKKAAVKKVKKEAPAEVKEHIVEEKLNQIMENATVTADQTVSKKKAAGFPWWGLVSLLLVLIFGCILLYEKNDDFRNNSNKLLNSTGLVKLPAGEKVEEAAKDPFLMKLTIVYNKDNQQMKTSIEGYLKNIESNLENTKVSATWLDRNDALAKTLIAKLDAKYLPIFTTDETIKNHPQYSKFFQAISLKNGEYQFQSEGMEYMSFPTPGEARYLGANPDKAKVVMIEYASFSCGYCKAMYPILQKVLKQYGKQVSLVVKHYNRGGIDILLGQAVECAADQGKLDPMMTSMYAKESDFISAMQNQEDPEKAVYDEITKAAKDAGTNSDKVLACIKAGTYADRISKDTAEGQEFGIMGTPSFFINKNFVGGAMEESGFINLIETELNK